MKKTLQKRLAFLVFLLGIAGNLLAQNMRLVSETDFSCSQKPDAHIASIDDVDGFGNSLIKPSLSTSLTLATSTESTTTKSDFLSKAQYAITSDPIHLDSLRMIDTNEWGFVTSSTNVKQSYLVMTVNGLKDNSKYRVEIEYAVPLTDDAIQSSFYNVALRAIVNPDQYNAETNGEMGHGLDLNNIKEGQTETLVITQNSMSSSPISDGTLKLYINTVKGALGQAIMIKSIKIYGEVDAKIRGKKSVCLGGETIQLSVADKYYNYPDSAYTWYKNGTVIPERCSRITHTSGKTPETHTYYYVMSIPDGKGNVETIKSKEHKVKDEICCMDENGEPMSQKLIWQDDFGTFTSATEYWTWDYTDLSNPKKVTHQASGNWVDKLPYEIPGAVYNDETGDDAPRPEGWYRVVSYLSDQGGSNLGWTAQAYDGRYPNRSEYALRKSGVDYFSDHTYQEGPTALGGMLQLNSGCYAGDVIYSRIIRGIPEKRLAFRCFINTFSDAKKPVSVFVRATEVNDSGEPVGEPFVSNPIKKYAMNDPESADWKEVKVEFELMQYTNVMVEIVSNVGDGVDGIDNAQGNDMLLDDIQLIACTSTEHVGVETQPAAEMDEMVNVYTISGIIVKTNVKRSEALNGLKKGSYYIVGHEKVLVDL